MRRLSDDDAARLGYRPESAFLDPRKRRNPARQGFSKARPRADAALRSDAELTDQTLQLLGQAVELAGRLRALCGIAGDAVHRIGDVVHAAVDLLGHCGLLLGGGGDLEGQRLEVVVAERDALTQEVERLSKVEQQLEKEVDGTRAKVRALERQLAVQQACGSHPLSACGLVVPPVSIREEG